MRIAFDCSERIASSRHVAALEAPCHFIDSLLEGWSRTYIPCVQREDVLTGCPQRYIVAEVKVMTSALTPMAHLEHDRQATTRGLRVGGPMDASAQIPHAARALLSTNAVQGHHGFAVLHKALRFFRV